MSTTKTHPATKYRVAIRDIGIRNGWTFTQRSGSTDRFEKSGTVIDVHHGPSNLIVKAELFNGKTREETGRAGKMFDVQAWLTGTPDPERENYIKLTPEQVAKYESGAGLAKIAAEHEIHTAPEPIPAAKPKAPRKAAAPKETASSETAKPAPRAAKTAPAAAK